MTASLGDRALRYCILQEVQKNKPVFESYKTLCKNLQDDSLEYKEFDFWFHRFVNGNFELDYDRSLDAKSKSLENLPIEIVKEVFDYLNFVDICLVRDVSQGFRALADNKVKVFKGLPLTIQFNQGLVEWCIGSTHCFLYEKVENGSKTTSGGEEIFVESGDYLREFITKFCTVIENSKIEISDFKISSDQESSEDFGRFTDMLNAAFESLNHKIHIEIAHFENVCVDTVYHILSSSKPGTLKNILIASIKEGHNQKFADIAGLEQWKRAIDLNVYCPSTWNLADVPIDTILHAKEFSYSCDFMAPNELSRVRETLFKSPNFKKGIIEFPRGYDFFPMVAALGKYMQRDTELPNYQYYRIPDSDETMMFHFDTYDDSVFIAKLSIE